MALSMKEDKEVLLNLDHIWKIEVEYGEVDPRTRIAFETSVSRAPGDPTQARFYRIFVGSESLLVPANPNDPVCAFIEKIYKDAHKSK